MCANEDKKKDANRPPPNLNETASSKCWILLKPQNFLDGLAILGWFRDVVKFGAGTNGKFGSSRPLKFVNVAFALDETLLLRSEWTERLGKSSDENICSELEQKMKHLTAIYCVAYSRSRLNG